MRTAASAPVAALAAMSQEHAVTSRAARRGVATEDGRPRMKYLARALPLLALSISVAGVLAATPASAQPQAPSYLAGSVQLINNNGRVYYQKSCTYRGGSVSPPTKLSNGCAVRVWLYQYSNDTGYTLCVNPRSTTGAFARTYRAYWVSSNSANC